MRRLRMGRRIQEIPGVKYEYARGSFQERRTAHGLKGVHDGHPPSLIGIQGLHEAEMYRLVGVFFWSRIVGMRHIKRSTEMVAGPARQPDSQPRRRVFGSPDTTCWLQVFSTGRGRGPCSRASRSLFTPVGKGLDLDFYCFSSLLLPRSCTNLQGMGLSSRRWLNRRSVAWYTCSLLEM
ncbi:hypothetical protein BKA80DRAFT_82829 [Phyllosticta citrichinensis]